LELGGIDVQHYDLDLDYTPPAPAPAPPCSIHQLAAGPVWTGSMRAQSIGGEKAA